MIKKSTESRATLRARRVLGACYLAAGVGKCFPSWESTEGRLEQALEANQGTPSKSPRHGFSANISRSTLWWRRR